MLSKMYVERHGAELQMVGDGGACHSGSAVLLQGDYYEAVAKAVDVKRKELVACFPKDAGLDEACFKISYDILIVGVGWAPAACSWLTVVGGWLTLAAGMPARRQEGAGLYCTRNKQVQCRVSVGVWCPAPPLLLLLCLLVPAQVGSVNNTFGIKGVSDHCMFFKSIEDASALRRRISECFERAALPYVSNSIARILFLARQWQRAGWFHSRVTGSAALVRVCFIDSCACVVTAKCT